MKKPGSGEDLFQVIFDAMPLPLFRMTREIEILDLNRAAQALFDATPAQALKKRGGDVMHCLNAIESPGGCGKGPACVDCRIRNAVYEVFDTGSEILRRRCVAEIANDDKVVDLELLITVTPIQYNGEMSALLCLEDISEITSLREIIPICANCKKIRDDQQLWNSLEHYFARFMGVDFTHSLCPDCVRILYPELLHSEKDKG